MNTFCLNHNNKASHRSVHSLRPALILPPGRSSQWFTHLLPIRFTAIEHCIQKILREQLCMPGIKSLNDNSPNYNTFSFNYLFRYSGNCSAKTSFGVVIHSILTSDIKSLNAFIIPLFMASITAFFITTSMLSKA